MIAMRRSFPGEVLAFVERAARYDTTGGNLDVEAIAKNGKSFVFTKNGIPVFGYTLETVGREVWITSAAGRADIDLTAKALQVIESQAQGFAAIVFETVRRGLVRKAARQGYTVAGMVASPGSGYILKKVLQ